MTQKQRLPPATVDLSCDECGELIGTMSLQTPHFLAKLYDMRRDHAKRTHDWGEDGDATSTSSS